MGGYGSNCPERFLPVLHTYLRTYDFRMTRHFEDNRILYSIGCTLAFIYSTKG